MSTSSYICQIKNEKIEFAYCHFDSYLSGVGETLLKNYNNQEIVDSLINLGRFSELKSTIERTLSASKIDGEVQVWEFDVFLDKMKKNTLIEYVYLFLNGKWKVIRFYDLKDKIIQAKSWGMFLALFSDLENRILDERIEEI